MALFSLAAITDKPTNLTVTAITSRSATISWLDSKVRGLYGLSNYRIEVKKDGNLILALSTLKVVNEYKIDSLTPYTTYEISVASGNWVIGFDDGTISSFLTSEEGECKNGCLLILKL